VRLVPLHDCSAAVQAQTVELLNAMWPKAEAVRLAQLQQSSAQFPLYLVLLSDDTADLDRVLGHAMLCRCVEDDRALLVESVVVDASLRGMGYGGRLMKLMHAEAKQRGFETLYLCTKDKRDFYQHLGYRPSGAVSPVSAASDRMDNDALKRLQGALGGGGAGSQFVWLSKSLDQPLE